MEQALEVVERMLVADAPFERIEAYIEARRDLSEEQRSVLWLIAWGSPEGRVTEIAERLGR